MNSKIKNGTIVTVSQDFEGADKIYLQLEQKNSWGS